MLGLPSARVGVALAALVMLSAACSSGGDAGATGGSAATTTSGASSSGTGGGESAARGVDPVITKDLQGRTYTLQVPATLDPAKPSTLTKSLTSSAPSPPGNASDPR